MIDLEEEVSLDEVKEKLNTLGRKLEAHLPESIIRLMKGQNPGKGFFIKAGLAVLVIAFIILNIDLLLEVFSALFTVLLVCCGFLFPVFLVVVLSRCFIKKKQKKENERMKDIQEYNNSAYGEFYQKPLEVLEKDPEHYAAYLIYRKLRPFEEQGAKFIFDLDIPTGHDNSITLDILFLHPKGIFAIHSKNHNGSIFGRENEKIWSKTLHKGLSKEIRETFQNPVIHSKIAVNHLRTILGSDAPLYSVVVFPNKANLNDVSVDLGVSVINLNMLGSIISAKMSHTTGDMPEGQLHAFMEELTPNRR